MPARGARTSKFLTVACPRCGAGVGEDCVLVSDQRSRKAGERSYTSHDDRKQAWAGLADQCPEFFRASGDCLCSCGRPYRDHPWDGAADALSYQGTPFLKILCDGKRVKL